MNLPIAFEEKMKKLLGEEFSDYIKCYEEPRFYGLRVNTKKITAAYLTDEYAEDEKKLKLKLIEGDDYAYDQLLKIILHFLDTNKEINSSIAAKLLKVEIKTASRLLSKAAKLDILKSYGKTKNKVYFRE